MFIFIVTLSALFIAGCAAFFSIKGITLLFAGSALSVGVMASSLEIGKLVAASFLHRQWSKISLSLKIYLCLAVSILMMITSLGIFGFLTRAYEEHRGVAVGYENELKGYDVQVKILQDELSAGQIRIESLNALRKDQEARVTAAGKYKAPREQAYKAIADADKEIAEKETKTSELRKKIGELEIKKTETSSAINTKTDVGTFTFVAKALNTDVDTAVKWFILSLVFVFDPLAVSLILALNQLVEEREKIKKSENVCYREPIEREVEKSEDLNEDVVMEEIHTAPVEPEATQSPKVEEPALQPVVSPEVSEIPETIQLNEHTPQKILVGKNNSIITIK